MKMKFVRNGRTKRRELLVATQRGEELDRKRATWLAEASESLLLEFAYDGQRGGPSALLHYDVEGLWSLKTFLSKRALVSQELLGLLEALLAVVDLCAARKMPTELHSTPKARRFLLSSAVSFMKSFLSKEII